MKLSTANIPRNGATAAHLRTSAMSTHTTVTAVTTDSDSRATPVRSDSESDSKSGSGADSKVANFDNIKEDIENQGNGRAVDNEDSMQDDNHGDSTSSGSGQDKDSTSKDTSSGTTSLTGNGKTDSSSSKFSLARQESADIMKLRALVITVLMACAVGVSAIVYSMSKKSEVSEYNDQYDATVKVVLDNFLNIMDSKMGVISTLGVALIAQAVHATDVNENFPFVTLTNFHERAATAVKQSGTVLVHFSPVVTMEHREAWESYSAGDAASWIQEGLDYQTEIGMFDYRNSDTFSQDGLSNFTMDSSRPIWRYGIDGERATELGEGPYMPVWQTTPVIYGGANVNQNLYKNDIDKQGAKLCVETGQFVMGSMLTRPPAGFEDEAYIYDDALRIDYINKDMELLLSTLMSIVKRKKIEYEGGPVGHVYFPIFDSFKKDRKPVAVMTAWIHWMDYFKNILPPVIEGVDIVLTNTCDLRSFTMRINGEDVVAVGPGDHHETSFDHMKRSASFRTVENISDGTKYGLPFNKDHCMVQMDVYPSETFYNIFNTKIPAAVTSAVAAVFLIAVILFFVYDYLVTSRQNMVMARAHKTQKLVNTLFPEDVAERMMEQAQKEHDAKKKGVFLNANKVFNGVLSEDELREQADDTPIADLFPFCTVLFADISGFTAWSSAREPAQVFILLQSIYEAFDKIAKRRKVFKVETIGDSYVAVTGLPDPQKNHAVIMTRFAGECRYVMKELCNKLEPRLGPDTADLSMRFGLHSGPVTAGVLRGAKARFQLFGDTVNTASRMESTGMAGRIQCSESTYNLLKKAGKDKWIKARGDGVCAKGKGLLKSWWLNPHTKHGNGGSSTGGGSSVTGSTTDITSDLITPMAFMSPTAALAEKAARRHQNLTAQEKRLVSWVTDLLHENIQKVVALRNATKTSATPSALKDVELAKPADGANTMDEVANIMTTPEFCQAAVDRQVDYRSVRLGEDVMTQLFDLVTDIAKLYHKNPFHNFEHACHVTMSVSKFIKRITSPGLAKLEDDSDHDFTIGINSDPLTVLAIIFSGVIHDADHRGVSNAQLSIEQPELGQKYRNKSVAEQNSLDLAWELLMQDRFVQLRDLLFTTQAEIERFRQALVNVVLATDIFDAELNAVRKGRWDRAFNHGKNKGTLTTQEFNDLRSTIVIEHIIQASDVSHTMQHWHVYTKWNAKLFKEMFTAYKSGRMAKNPADFWYQGEIGFFDNYIIPLAKKLKDCQVFGVSSYECLDYAIQNRNEWKERGQEIVENLVKELTSPVPVAGGKLDALVEDEAPAVPTVIGGENLKGIQILPLKPSPSSGDQDDSSSADDDINDISMKDIPLEKEFTVPLGEKIDNFSKSVPMAA